MNNYSTYNVFYYNQPANDDSFTWQFLEVYCPMCESYHENNTYCQINFGEE